MMKTMKILKTALACFSIMTILCGILYTATVTGIAQLIFPMQANGSIISTILKDGSQKAYGSALIGQEFTTPEYLIGRPMGTTNLSPVGKEQAALVEKRVAWWYLLEHDKTEKIPMDLVTASGSGVDPNISPEAAEYQVVRISRERNVSKDAVRAIIEKYTTGRFLGIWGEPTVNVLKVNLALDGLL
jgi:potassium-transporting ATPase KdpC subunit